MKKRTMAMYAAGGVAVAALLAWAFAPQPQQVEVAKVAQGRFESTIDEDGRTRVRDRFVVSAPLAGRLHRIRLREGDTVAAGDVLAVLTPALSPLLDDRTLREQRARLDVARAQRDRASARVGRARVALLQATHDAARTEQLARQGFVSPNRLDNDRLAVEAAKRELETANGEARMAEHEETQARAALSAIREPAGAGFEVRAPVGGRVLKLLAPSEGPVATGAPLLEIGDTASLELVADLLTTDAMRVGPGSPVRVERWGGPHTLEGRVRLIEPAGFTKVSALGVEEQRVEVVMDLTSPPQRWSALGDGFRVGVRVVVTQVPNAVKVPVGAVFPLAGDANGTASTMGCFVVEADRARLVQVDVAARNADEAWVRQGLAPGAQVIVYPAASLRDGSRVAVRSVRGPTGARALDAAQSP
ncbi:MAG TPA: efflux RND transporter periplasmic adaptor subunit [Rhizobacter sp.]